MGVRVLEGMAEEISLLHMNCEGCEWEMLETLLKDPDVISRRCHKFEVICTIIEKHSS